MCKLTIWTENAYSMLLEMLAKSSFKLGLVNYGWLSDVSHDFTWWIIKVTGSPLIVKSFGSVPWLPYGLFIVVRSIAAARLRAVKVLRVLGWVSGCLDRVGRAVLTLLLLFIILLLNFSALDFLLLILSLLTMLCRSTHHWTNPFNFIIWLWFISESTKIIFFAPF